MAAIIYKNKDGKRIPGTTTIIGQNLGWNKEALKYWCWSEGLEGRNYKDSAQRAADVGTIAHKMIEAELKGYPFDASQHPTELVENAEIAYLAWLEWKNIVEFSLLASELSLVSEQYQYGGTIDIAAVKQKRAIVDLKTSNGIYPDHLLQIAAYGQLYNENHPNEPIEGYYLLRLGKDDGSFHYHYWHSLPEAWKAFQFCLELHKLQKTLKKQA